MKVWNDEIGLVPSDFSIENDNFKILSTGYEKIFKYYKLPFDAKNFNTNPNAELIKLKDKIKKITGSRFFDFSGLNDKLTKPDEKSPKNPFAESEVWMFLMMLGIVKDSSESIYLATGNYYENAIRNSINEEYGIKKWDVPVIFNKDTSDDKLFDDFKPMKVNGKLINSTDTNFIRTFKGNYFDNKNEITLNYNNQTYHIDLSVFGGLPDGIPTFSDEKNNNLFKMIEVKTKLLEKFENTINYDDFGNKEYVPLAHLMSRIMLVDYENDEISNVSLVGEEIMEKDFMQKIKSKLEALKSTLKPNQKLMIVNGDFSSVVYAKRSGLPQLQTMKVKEIFADGKMTQDNFKINNASYYSQASLYLFLNYLKQKAIKSGEANLTKSDAESLITLFLMGIVDAKSYILPDYNNKKFNVGLVEFEDNKIKINDVKVDDKLIQAIYNVNAVYKEYYHLTDYAVYDDSNKIYNLFDVMDVCQKKYKDWFFNDLGVKLSSENDFNSIKAIMNYLETQEKKIKISQVKEDIKLDDKLIELDSPLETYNEPDLKQLEADVIKKQLAIEELEAQKLQAELQELGLKKIKRTKK